MTPKRERFIEEYLVDLNGTQAAIRAGYSRRTANEQASRLLTFASVRDAIAAAQQERSERTKIDAGWLLEKLREAVTADVSELYEENGTLRPVSDWPMAFRTGLVAGLDIEHRPDGEDVVTVKKVKLADRTRLLELIGRHIGVQAFKDRVEVEDVTDRAVAMRKRRQGRLAGRSTG